MSKFLDCNGVPLKVGDKCFIVDAIPECKSLLGKIVTVLNLNPETEECYPNVKHEELILFGDTYCNQTDCDMLMKLQDLDDDEILQNNVLFSTTTDTWERITDYPKHPTMEPELVPT